MLEQNLPKNEEDVIDNMIKTVHLPLGNVPVLTRLCVTSKLNEELIP